MSGERLWEMRTNRHPTTSGRLWGWIEGAPGYPVWSDDDDPSCMTREEAARRVREHNAALRTPEETA